MTDQIIRDANELTSQRLISHYLPSPEGHNAWTHEGACLSARRVANRSGVPPDATSWRYLVQHPDQGWSYAARTVWREGSLMRPLAVHTVIECYTADDETIVPTEEAAVLAVNDWLCSLPL
jgi:hypothetical protein